MENLLSDPTWWKSVKVNEFVTFKCMEGHRTSALEAAALFKEIRPRSVHHAEIDRIAMKSAVGAADVSDVTSLERAFVEWINPFTLIGRLTGVRRVPFNVVVHQSTLATGFDFVGRGKPTPLTAGDFDTTHLDALKIGGIVAETKERLRLERPGELEIVKTDLKAGLVAFQDSAFVDPAAAAVAGERPASITNAATPIPSVGTQVTDAKVDLKSLILALLAGGGKLETAMFLLSSVNAVALRLSGDPAFDQLGRDGGFIAGVPTLASAACQNNLIILDTSKLLLADDLGIDIEIARHATLEMKDASLTQNGLTGTGTTLVSLWHTGLVGLKVMRHINWQLLTGGAQYVSNASYISTGSPA